MNKSLVIVESPSKAKTINKYLGKGVNVKATIGHIKDLPKNKFAVEIENNYKPTFTTLSGKKKVIDELRKYAKDVEKIYIATDPDREGEAIASDIADVISDVNNNIHRVLFYEITKSGIVNAMNNPRKVDNNLVNAQIARRIMDRILGYKVSPFLWKLFYYGLSAGRVQSVALKLICEREEEIMKFVPVEYWSIEGLFAKLSGTSKQFSAKLYKINEETLKFNGEKPCIENISQAHKIIEDLKNSKFKVTDIQTKETKRNSPLPFTTSMLQQTASVQLGFSPKKTMLLAQKLYEGVEITKGEGNIGLITYMRTDSTRISNEAREMANEYILNNFGEMYLGSKKTAPGKKLIKIQDAHEAVRPTDVFITPEKIKKIDKDLLSLYRLIWKRFVASQMSAAVYNLKTVIIKSVSPKGTQIEYFFKAVGRTIKFDGFLRIYEDLKYTVNGNEEEEDISVIPDDIEIDTLLNALNIRKEQHFTKPPPRYSESSLIKQLDSLGIGRPSTFATIVSTVIDRKYIEVLEKRLKATELGMTVNKILSKHFPDIINIEFTANMENELDTIASGKSTYKNVLDDFYMPFNKDFVKAEDNIKNIKNELVEMTDIVCPECGETTNAKMIKKWGRNGQFLACERYPKCKSSMPLPEEKLQMQEIARNIKCDLCGSEMIVRKGRYGDFLGCSNYPKCKGVKPITLGIVCPKCNEGEIIKRVSKGKKSFYGCSKYPSCDFIENYRPVLENCKSCGNKYLLKKYSKNQEEYHECPVCKTVVK